MARWRWRPMVQRLPFYSGACRARRCARQISTSGTGRIERIELRCGSSGTITIDLHGLGREPSPGPFLIYLPSFAPRPGSYPFLPEFLQPYPTAVINYRWRGPASLAQGTLSLEDEQPDFTTPLHWPAPIHDVSFAYQWIIENILPLGTAGRRDAYVYGNYLGATLAASLALTESHRHRRLAVRGFAAYNGIYNWSMFLPDHRINKPTTSRRASASRAVTQQIPPHPEGSPLHLLNQELSTLFAKPADLFDSFASPSLFFQTPGMWIPTSFSQSTATSALIDKMATLSTDGSSPADLLSAWTTKPPRRSNLIFPPRKSTLKIPPSLLLHDSPDSPSSSTSSSKKPTTRKKKAPSTTSTPKPRQRIPKGNHFQAQATELASLMRRSVEMIELKERQIWDDELDWEAVAGARVKVVDVGEREGGQTLSPRGLRALTTWLDEHILL